VYEGDEVVLPCHATPSSVSASVKWLYTETDPLGLIYRWDIYVNGQVYETLRQRFSIHNATGGDYSLKMSTIHLSDAGLYRCLDQRLLQQYLVNVSGVYSIFAHV